MKSRHLLAFLIMTLPFALAAATAAPADVAEQTLRQRLVAAYPAVNRWDIRRLGNVRSTPQVDDSLALVDVQDIGARSKVLIRFRDGAGREVIQYRWYAVSGFAPVLVATRDLPIRTDIDETAVEIRESDLLGLPCSPLTDRLHVTDTRLRVSVKGRQMICSEMLEPRPAVTKGDRVSVRYESGLITLQSSGLVQQDAAVGEKVQIRKPGTAGTFAAVVVAPGEVAVHE